MELELRKSNAVILVLGKVDSGKTTFTLNLANKFFSEGKKVVIVDADPGQADIGPPGTLSAGVLNKEIRRLSDVFPVKLVFIGSISPAGLFMWPTVWGVYELVAFARSIGEIVIIDSSGLITGRDGYTLVKSKLSLIRPDITVFLGNKEEYYPLIGEANRYSLVKVFPPLPGVRKKPPEERRLNRIRRWRGYFDGAFDVELSWNEIKIGGFPLFGIGAPLPKEWVNEVSLELEVEVIWAERCGDTLKCLVVDPPRNDTKLNLEWISLDYLKKTLIGLEGKEGLIDVGLVMDADKERLLVKTHCLRLREIERVLLSKLRVDDEVFRS